MTSLRTGRSGFGSLQGMRCFSFLPFSDRKWYPPWQLLSAGYVGVFLLRGSVESNKLVTRFHLSQKLTYPALPLLHDAVFSQAIQLLFIYFLLFVYFYLFIYFVNWRQKWISTIRSWRIASHEPAGNWVVDVKVLNVRRRRFYLV
jgi:hypothetical protein